MFQSVHIIGVNLTGKSELCSNRYISLVWTWQESQNFVQKATYRSVIARAQNIVIYQSGGDKDNRGCVILASTTGQKKTFRLLYPWNVGILYTMKSNFYKFFVVVNYNPFVLPETPCCVSIVCRLKILVHTDWLFIALENINGLQWIYGYLNKILH